MKDIGTSLGFFFVFDVIDDIDALLAGMRCFLTSVVYGA